MAHSFTIQKTIAVNTAAAFNAFSSAKELSTWFTTKHKHTFRPGGKYTNGDGDKGKYISIVPRRLISFSWENEQHCPGTEVQIRFKNIKTNKTKIKLTHSKLATPMHVADMKTGWSWALACLKSYLETGKKITFEDWYKGKNAS
jgi:uncharacterized protein YndB with AHSA1/START domain